MRKIVYVCGLAAALATISAAPVLAQTVAVGPYYAVPSWDQTIACAAPASCPRFVVLANMDSNAVLDRETGLVWERAPRSAKASFVGAAFACANLITGDRFGWRVPSLAELQTLVQPSKHNPALPDGHPFTNVQFDAGLGFPTFDYYWTTTPDPHAFVPPFGLAVSFKDGSILSDIQTSNHNFWCVRGETGATN